MRFISHHDFMRLVERAARRAELPLKYSEGFNPHPRISYPLARPAGVEGRDEIVELVLTHPMTPAEVEESLNAQVPEGLHFYDGRVTGPRAKARVTGLCYTIEPAQPDLVRPRAIDDLLSREKLEVTRKKSAGAERTVDIRRFIRSVDWRPPVLEVALNVSIEGTARLQEILQHIGLVWPDDVRYVARTVEAAAPRPSPGRTPYTRRR